MKIAYDPQTDILRILFTNAPIDRSRDTVPGVVFNYDDQNGLVALELRDASRKVHDPCTSEYFDTDLADDEEMRQAAI